MVVSLAEAKLFLGYLTVNDVIILLFIIFKRPFKDEPLNIRINK